MMDRLNGTSQSVTQPSYSLKCLLEDAASYGSFVCLPIRQLSDLSQPITISLPGEGRDSNARDNGIRACILELESQQAVGNVHSPLHCNCTAPAAPVCNNVKARDPLEILDIDIEGTSARRRVLRLYKSKADNVVAILEVEKVFKEGSNSVVGKGGRLCCPC